MAIEIIDQRRGGPNDFFYVERSLYQEFAGKLSMNAWAYIIYLAAKGQHDDDTPFPSIDTWGMSRKEQLAALAELSREGILYQDDTTIGLYSEEERAQNRMEKAHATNTEDAIR